MPYRISSEKDLKPRQSCFSRVWKQVCDVCVTLLLWLYYVPGWLLLGLPFYLFAYFFSTDRESAFQRLNHLFHRGFFMLVRSITPGLILNIQEEIRELNGCVILGNHLSYLDPILMVSLFPKQKTVVKSDFFHYPVFGWLLKTSGYLPSTTDGSFSDLMITRVAAMPDYLAGGGNLFVFPEAHRSRDGRLGPFSKGVFTIARRCRAPIVVLSIRNTDRLFPPDRYLFNTCMPHTVDVSIVARLAPDYDSDAFSLSGLMTQVRTAMENAGKRRP
jgi:1-acyl-sn-glycerol-3-phosphate acyltransferase